MKKETRNELIKLIVKIGLLAIFGVVLFGFLFGATRLSDKSMDLSVKDGDLLIYYRMEKTYFDGDVVVYDANGKTIAGRIVGLPGDVINVTEDNYTVNGYVRSEPNISSNTYRFESDVEFPLTVGENEMFILGDNREVATDSRILGPIKNEDIKGKLMIDIRRRNF